ncbi:MAG TPA: putative porin [bacterium]|nr:putative porin [bacterium]
MKRFWLLALLAAGTLSVALGTPAFAAKSDEGAAEDTGTSMDDVNSAMGSMTSHMNDIDKKLHLNFSGDVRVRYAFICQSASQTGVTIGDSSRGRYRARFGVSKKLGDFTGKFRIATGSSAAPFSQNNTFDTAMANPSILIDTASLTWDPAFSNGVLSFTVGKMGNPLTKTSITWDPDIQPEGALMEIKKGDFALRATYFELQNLFASGTTFGNMDIFMDNVQAEIAAKFDTDTSLGLMAGFEYIPNGALLTSGATGIGAVLGAGKNPVTSYGGVVDNGPGVGRNWDIAEGMIYFKHKLGDVPMKWYGHFTDNLNGTNLTALPVGTYSNTFTNQYAWLFGVDIGATKSAGDFAGSLYVASLDPNCNLPYLLDDDPGESNRQYVFGSLSFLAEDGVLLKLSEWAVQHEYYAIAGVGSANALGGSSQNPELVTYLDCILNL